MRPSLISSFDPSPGPWRWRRGEHPALGFHRWLCARGMNDALHGREAWRPPGKRDRGRRREMGSRVSAHHGPGEATLDSVNLGSNPGPPARESASNRCVFVVSSLAGIVLKNRRQPETPNVCVRGANGRRVSRGRFRVVGCGAFRLDFDGGLGGEALHQPHKPQYGTWPLCVGSRNSNCICYEIRLDAGLLARD